MAPHLDSSAGFLFFAALLLAGICIFRDYGISWDEPMQRNAGQIAMRYVTGKSNELFSYRDKNYGTAFELPLAIAERIFGLTGDPQSVFAMRHFATFLLFFIGVIFFYKLCRYRFRSRMAGLAGALFLVLSPRIFAGSFYNSKDIPFLSVFIISIYTLIRYLNTPTPAKALLHALASAILIDIRVVGIVMPLFTIAFLTLDTLTMRKGAPLKRVFIDGKLAAYAFFLAVFTIAFWPLLWRHPLYNFIAAFREMSHYNFPYQILYLGRFIGGRELPWHYLPVWIAISTPLFYIVFFIIGCAVSAGMILKNPLTFLKDKRDDLLFLSWFFFPVIMIIALKSVLYDDWRQVYFIYPALILIAMIGIEAFFKIIKDRFVRNENAAKIILVIVTTLGLAPTAAFMIKNHPYQNVYFNTLAGRDMADIKKKFELDCWGLSYGKALAYILATDKSPEIKIYAANLPGIFNALAFPAEERKRLIFADKPEDAKYFVSNYRWHPEDYPYKDEYYSIKIGNAKIMVVYRLK